MRSKTIALVVGTATAFATPVPAQPQTAQDNYVHEASGMQFPASAGKFRRMNITDYDGDGRNIGAHYRTEQHGEAIDITVYIYPGLSSRAPGNERMSRAELCAEEFAQVSAEVERHPGARLLEKGAIGSPSPYHKHKGLKAIFQLDSIGQRQGPLRSEADLFCQVGGRWSIKYRTTAGSNVAYGGELTRFMHDLVWPAFPQTDIAALVSQGSAPRP